MNRSLPLHAAVTLLTLAGVRAEAPPFTEVQPLPTGYCNKCRSTAMQKGETAAREHAGDPGAVVLHRRGIPGRGHGHLLKGSLI